MLEFARLRTGTAIVIDSAWLDASNALATMMSLSEISKVTLSASMKTVAGGERFETQRAATMEDGMD